MLSKIMVQTNDIYTKQYGSMAINEIVRNYLENGVHIESGHWAVSVENA